MKILTTFILLLISLSGYSQSTQFSGILYPVKSDTTTVNDSTYQATFVYRSFSNTATDVPANVDTTQIIFADQCYRWRVDSVVSINQTIVQLHIVNLNNAPNPPNTISIILEETINGPTYVAGAPSNLLECVDEYFKLNSTVGGGISQQTLDDSTAVLRSAIKIDSIDVLQDSIIVAYLDGTEVSRDTIAGTGSDGSIINELDTLTVAGDSGSTTLTNGETLTVAGAGGATTSVSGDTLTVTATEVDGSTTNEQLDAVTFSGDTVTVTENGIDYIVDLKLDAGVVSITPTDSVTVDIDFDNHRAGRYQVDMTTAATSTTVTLNAPTNPVSGNGVYTFHFQNTASNDVDFPTNFLDETGTAWDASTTYSMTADFFMTCYYDGTNYYCN